MISIMFHSTGLNSLKWRSPHISEPLDIFMPCMLRHTDVSELARAVGEVRFARTRKADGKPRDRATDAEGVAWLWERLGI